ncbi:unnamed protein product, partial [Brachionus calyciflorus]
MECEFSDDAIESMEYDTIVSMNTIPFERTKTRRGIDAIK